MFVFEAVMHLLGCVFFVSVGMLVEPAVLVEYALPLAVIVLAILFGQSILGSFGYLLSGQTLKTAMRCGFSMAQIGEFAFIIASLGLSLCVIGKFLYPVVVAVSVITTFLTPYMIRASEPCYSMLERRLPEKWIVTLNHITLAHPSGKGAKNNWKHLLRQMIVNTVIYTILSVTVVALMLTLFLPFIRHVLVGWHWTANFICGSLTVLFIAPFLRAMIMKKNHSDEFKALWAESRINHLPLIFTIIVRVVIASSFVFYVCNYLSRFANALIIAIAVAVVLIMIMSRSLKHSSIRLERMFVQNLRSRDIEAQVHGRKRPLYEGHLLDRNVHMSDVDVPMDSMWSGKTLLQLELRQRFGVHVSSILRADRRINIPDGKTLVFPGDRLQVIGADSQLAKLAEALQHEVYGSDPDIESKSMRLRQMAITGGSPLLGVTLRESGIRSRYNCMVVGIEEGEENLSQMTPDRKFEKGDIIWIVGEERHLAELLDK